METKIILLIIFWLIGGIVNLFTSERIRDYKCYSSPRMFLCIGIFLSFAASWAIVYLNIVHGEFYLPKWIYHDCNKHSTITFEDTDYDVNGNVMEEYDIENFGHRETYKVFTCGVCGKVRKIRLQ